MRIVIALAALVASIQASAETPAILAGRVIADPATPALGPSTMLVKDGRIVSIAPGRKRPAEAARVIESATMVAAKSLDLEGEIGKIAPGYSADLIAVGGDPMRDVRQLETVDFVMVRGRVIE